MGDRTGTFVWRELMTPDTAKSIRFYGELFGWNVKEVPMGPGETYNLIHRANGTRDIGGMMKFTQAPPTWCSYVGVSDVDATVAAVKSAGGKVMKEGTDIPNVGRFAVVTDADGAAFFPFKGTTPRDTEPLTEMPQTGDFCWEQLSAPNLEKSAAFYQKALGWTAKAGPGGMGSVFYKGETMVASAMQAPPGVPPHWMTFVVVDDLAAANARATRLGGSVLMPKIEVPDMGAFSVVKDDVGAVIGLYKGK